MLAMQMLNILLVGSFFFGHGISPNYIQALNWYIKVEHNGKTVSMHDIGSIYRNGHRVTNKITTDIAWFTKPVMQENIYPQFNLRIFTNIKMK
jgi:TPR repeat protein